MRGKEVSIKSANQLPAFRKSSFGSHRSQQGRHVHSMLDKLLLNLLSFLLNTNNQGTYDRKKEIRLLCLIYYENVKVKESS